MRRFRGREQGPASTNLEAGNLLLFTASGLRVADGSGTAARAEAGGS